MRLQIKWSQGWASAHGTGPDGKRIRRALKTQDPRRAEELRAQIESRIWQADLYGAKAVVTFDECALHYAEDGGDVRFLVQITTQLSGIKLNDITPSMIRAAAKRAYPTGKNSTVNRQGIVPAQAVVNHGHSEGWCPPIRVRKFPEDKPKRVAVDRQYLEALKPHLPIRLFTLMLFLQQTGRRVQEALDLTPKDIRGDKAFIAKTKNGEAAVASFTTEVQELISRFEPRHGLVFGYVKRSSLYPTLRRACKKADVPYLGTHQVGRHSFATSLSEAGWSVKAIAEAGGWKTTRMVSEIYEHPVNSQEKSAAHFEAIGKKLAKRPKPRVKKAHKNKGN
jgi:integrase